MYFPRLLFTVIGFLVSLTLGMPTMSAITTASVNVIYSSDDRTTSEFNAKTCGLFEQFEPGYKKYRFKQDSSCHTADKLLKHVTIDAGYSFLFFNQAECAKRNNFLAFFAIGSKSKKKTFNFKKKDGIKWWACYVAA